MDSTSLTETLLDDPLAIGAVIVIAIGAIVLIWAVVGLFRKSPSDEISLEPGPTEEETPPPSDESLMEPAPTTPPPSQEPERPLENPDLLQQVIERLNQLTERIYNLEKQAPSEGARETTAAIPAELDMKIQAVADRVAALENGGPPLDVAAKIELISNRLMTLEKVVQGNQRPLGTESALDREVSLAMNSIADRLSTLEKNLQTIQSGAGSSQDTGGASPADSGKLEALKDKIANLEKYIRQIISELEAQAQSQETQKTKLNNAVDKLIALEGELKAAKESKL